MPKTKTNPKKKKIIQIVLLLSVLAAFALLLIFVTLPALGIEIFGGKKTTGTTVRPATTTANKTPSTVSSVSVEEITLDEKYLKKVIESFSEETEVKTYYEPEAFKPYIFNFQDEERVKNILINSTSIIEFRDGTYMSYFLTEDGVKTAWIKTSAEPNKVYELNINSVVPNVPYPLQVIEITPMGILLYRYPDEREQEEKATPRLYRILARPYIEIAELKTEIKQ
ncbi:MAG: hypothetical protein U9N62_03030 [Thermotogota bacterium]|nr:hypothetical protein [Thermotogota bacterium]